MKVLILEKDKTVRQSLSYFIEHQKNCEVFLASSKKEGISLFKTVPFDIVLCGDRLPDGEGLELLKEWTKKDPNLISILLTVHGDELLRQEAIKAGIRGYLVKPFELKQLEEAMGMKSSEFACPDQIGGVRSSELRISGK
ncbi:MAG: response regulator [Deltaproteobacteria bacterium]|nr:response regulator [Deltaproteobacteria bacterium]